MSDPTSLPAQAPAQAQAPSHFPETPGLLQGRLALITGAASGIGQAIAISFAKAGARVIVTDLDTARCADTLAQVKAAGVAAGPLRWMSPIWRPARRWPPASAATSGRWTPSSTTPAC